MAKFRKKPVVIEAVRIRWENWNELIELAGRGLTYTGPDSVVMRPVQNREDSCSEGAIMKCMVEIKTLEGTMIGNEDDWLIRGVKGEIYPCKPDIFAATYDLVEDGVE